MFSKNYIVYGLPLLLVILSSVTATAPETDSGCLTYQLNCNVVVQSCPDHCVLPLLSFIFPRHDGCTYCGASVVDKRYIVTLAECVRNGKITLFNKHGQSEIVSRNNVLIAPENGESGQNSKDLEAIVRVSSIFTEHSDICRIRRVSVLSSGITLTIPAGLDGKCKQSQWADFQAELFPCKCPCRGMKDMKDSDGCAVINCNDQSDIPLPLPGCGVFVRNSEGTYDITGLVSYPVQISDAGEIPIGYSPLYASEDSWIHRCGCGIQWYWGCRQKNNTARCCKY